MVILKSYRKFLLENKLKFKSIIHSEKSVGISSGAEQDELSRWVR